MVGSMIEKAQEYGFDAVYLPVSELVFTPEFRMFCEQNLCGNYGRNYSCPPSCGTAAEMEEKVRKYEHALVLRTQSKVNNAMSGAETLPLKKFHSKLTAELARELRANYEITDSLCIGAGPCGLCKRCLMLDGQPCPYEKERYSCVSAYCLNVSALAESAGMPLSWDLDQVTYFSLFVF